MKLEVLKSEYPKSYQLFLGEMRTRIFSIMSESMREYGVEGEAIPTMENLSLGEEDLENIMNASLENPYSTFEVLDRFGVKIAIIPHPEDENAWLHYNSEKRESFRANSRKEAEIAAFDIAIKILETKLDN